MSAYKKYPAYKDSGVEWLGEVPEGWGTFPLFGAVSERSESNIGMREVNLLSLSYGRIVRKDIESNDGLLPDSFETYQVIHPGDIVLRLTDLQNDKRSLRSALASERGIITSAYLAIQTHQGESRFLAYLLRAYDLLKVFYSMGGGLRQSMKFSDLKRLPVVMPSPQEQTAIAAYLDRETAKIDALIAAQRRLIDLLREKRSALISHAVTKGLNPDAPMKDSGVEWLGEVPEGWDVFPLKRLAKTQLSNVDKHTTDGERSVKLCNYVDVYKNERITSDLPFMPATASDDQIRRLSIRRGDVIITKDSETPDDIGVPSLVAENLEGVVCGYHLALLRPLGGKVVGGYLAKLLKSAYVRAHFSTSAVGMTRYGLGKYDIENVLLPAPSHAEQTAIAAFLDRETAKIDALIAKTEKAIELAQERRSALISAAVTGKIDVRDAATQSLVDQETALV